MTSSPAEADRWDSEYHAPVLVREVLGLMGMPGTVLDGTLGGGGHSLAFLEHGARLVVGVDRDPDALASARARLGRFEAEGRFIAVRGTYDQVDTLPEIAGRRFDAALLDLGISSHQVDDASRGFTFREGAPLDMRMGDEPRTAADILNTLEEPALVQLFREYGDEPRAGRLAREVIRRRATRPFATSDDFVGAIRGALGARSGPAEFARLFQALRIAVNDELAGISSALPKIRDLLAPGGVLAVIAYHSGEDRLVKHAFREWSVACTCPPLQPRCICGGIAAGEVITRKAVTAPPDEVARNPRARSARLRAWRRAS